MADVSLLYAYHTHIMLFRDQINTKCTVFTQNISRHVERKDKKKQVS